MFQLFKDFLKEMKKNNDLAAVVAISTVLLGACMGALIEGGLSQRNFGATALAVAVLTSADLAALIVLCKRVR